MLCVLDSIAVHVAVLDSQGLVVAANKAWTDMIGPGGPKGLHIRTGDNFLHLPAAEDDGEAVAKAVKGVSEVLDGSRSGFRMEYPFAGSDGRRWFIMESRPYAHGGAVVTFNDVTGRREIEEHMVHCALHDPLTGLSNRSLFMDRLGMAMKRARRHGDYGFAVLVLDIDRFNLVNDSLGHVTGDRVLMGVASRLKNIMRSVDTLARLGGDEFAVLLDDTSDIDEVRLVASRMQDQLQQPFKIKKQPVFVSASVGVAMDMGDHEAPDQVLRDADNAVNHAKEAGGARVRFFTPTMHEAVKRRVEMEMALRDALDGDQFRLHYQPIFSISDGVVKGFEALVRWQHPRRGLVSPVDFIPIAEETGLIVPLGGWILRQALLKLKGLMVDYPGAGLVMNVNISPLQLSRPEFLDEVRNLVREIGVPTSRVKLEITESILVRGGGRAAEMVLDLKKLGFKVAIDDFGTGYSSLQYLERFPVDSLKLDRSFVARMGKTRESREIVRTIVSMAHSLGMEVVAEGVEEEYQLDILAEMKCQKGQGYLFSRPLDEKKFLDRISDMLAGTWQGFRLLGHWS